MTIFILALNLSCPVVFEENNTKFPWNNHDKKTQLTAAKRCPILYPDAPCLKRFIKTGKQDYIAICGEPNAD